MKKTDDDDLNDIFVNHASIEELEKALSAGGYIGSPMQPEDLLLPPGWEQAFNDQARKWAKYDSPYFMSPNCKIRQEPECEHAFVDYIGFNDSFRYCTKCDKKERP